MSELENKALEMFGIITEYDIKTLGDQKRICREIAQWHLDALASAQERIEELEKGPSIQVSDGDVWLVFPDALISIEGICNFGPRGPIVQRNIRKWRDEILATHQGEK